MSTLVIIVGCILACFLGSTLPDYDPSDVIYFIVLMTICIICAVINKFPLLVALGIWTPFSLPLPVFKSFPTIGLVFIWIMVVLLFRLCLTGSIRYIKSYNLFLLITFAWVPVRFLMNPVHKLGASVAGGNGVSGALPYFEYILAGFLLLTVGGVLNTRENIMSFMRWSLAIVFITGMGLLYCAFNIWTAPYLLAMGSFSAGNMGDGIQRLVQLPGYGIFLMEAALCPGLFLLKKRYSVVLFALGSVMVIVGGNRSAIAAAIAAVPVILLLRRQSHAIMLSLVLSLAGLLMLHVYVASTDVAKIPMLIRGFGIFESKIDQATGGSASANWRYTMWQSGLEKIEENPLIGKGFGNLPDRLDAQTAGPTGPADFESLLAGGEAHNGFITAAYGFGIPFMAILACFIFIRLFSHAHSALTTDRHDAELRDLHALLAGLFASFPVIIYTALDLSQAMVWLYTGIGIILAQLKIRAAKEHPPAASSTGPLDQAYRYQPYYSSKR
jgi:O-antigen ligase